ncbi:MAG TPA: transketolase [Solirubrobacteraceae bacterium]|nr:transketolase [Solirubrobacteraceae bacterium]
MATTSTTTDPQTLAARLRVDSIRTSEAAGSGHPTSSLSAADLAAVLLTDHLRCDFTDADNPHNDHLIFSKGHASPLFYAIHRAVGAIDEEELLTYRQAGSRLQGHPVPLLPFVDVATGSLGQGLPIGVGVALAGRDLDRLDYRVWVLCGDSEMAEGSMWEAFEHAGHERLANLTAIIDVNRLGQTGETRHGWDLEAYATRARAFGWKALTIDGHDVAAIDAAYSEAVATTEQPTVIIARTLKGRGVAAVEDQEGAHGKPVPDSEDAIAELGDPGPIEVQVAAPSNGKARHRFQPVGDADAPRYEVGGDPVATRKAYGDALAALGARRGDVVALDGEVSNSTHSEEFSAAHPERYFEMYIAEQQMVAAAVGMQVRDWTAFASTFAAFLSRAYDFVRMAAVSRADLRLCGSHAGVSIGEDGPSQMALEDLASLRAIHGSTVLYPCDPNQTVQLVEAMADLKGISYLRTTRGKFPTLYEPDEKFPVGGAKVVRSSAEDRVAIVGAGVTVHEALTAADTLEQEGVHARVIDLYSVKPIDVNTLVAAVRECGGRMVTVEDHWPEGGLGEAVLSALAGAGVTQARVTNLGVQGMPGSAPPADLLREAGIDAEAIATAARELTRD